MANKSSNSANKPEQKQYMTIREVSELSGLSYAAVKRDVDGGRLPAHRIGRKYLLPAAAAEDYIRSRRADREVDGYTIGELQQLLPLSYAFIIGLIHRGELPAVKQGRRYVVPKADLQRFLAQARV